MRRILAIGALWVLLPVPAVVAQAQQQEVKHHGMMHQAMQMHHPVSQTAKLTVENDPAAQTMTIRVGPVTLPAHADHMTVAQPREFFLSISFDGWVISYHPSLTDATGQPLPSKLLHHVGFYNTARRNILCPDDEEHIFGAGGEMNDWPALPGFGYYVHKGDRIRISSMFANPTDTTYPDVYLEVRMEYRVASAGGEALKDVYPLWFDVMECRNHSAYDLAPGKSITSGKFRMRYAGALLGVGGHVHNYGQELVLRDLTRKETIATLDAKLGPAGHIVAMPVFSFADRGGYRLERDDVIEVAAVYDNPIGKRLPDGAMGIVVGYLLPDREAALAALERPRKQ